MRIEREPSDSPQTVRPSLAKSKVMYELIPRGELWDQYRGRIVVRGVDGQLNYLDGGFALSANHPDFDLLPLPVGARVVCHQTHY